MHNNFEGLCVGIYMKRTFTPGHQIKSAWHSISRMYNSYTNEVGMTVPTAYVLLLLSVKKGTLSTQIAPLLGMEAGSITRLLKSMEEQQLILRTADQQDKRQVSVYLTNDGMKKRHQARKIVALFNHKLDEEIQPEKLKNFLHVLHQIVTIAEQNHFKEKTL